MMAARLHAELLDQMALTIERNRDPRIDILPLHPPIDVAKAAASIDRLSGGRFVFGVASGDRPVEYPAYGRDANLRAELFREAFDYVEAFLTKRFPVHESAYYGRLAGGGDLVPKPLSPRLPTLVTGQSQQSLDWIAQRSDGWLTYPRNVIQQAQVASEWREALDRLSRIQATCPIALRRPGRRSGYAARPYPSRISGGSTTAG